MVPRTGKFIETETRRVFARGWRTERWRVFNGDRVSVWEDERVLEMDGGGDV